MKHQAGNFLSGMTPVGREALIASVVLSVGLWIITGDALGSVLMIAGAVSAVILGPYIPLSPIGFLHDGPGYHATGTQAEWAWGLILLAPLFVGMVYREIGRRKAA